MTSQYARARTWLASAKDDWLLPLSKAATIDLLAEHDALVAMLEEALEFLEDQEDVIDGDYGIPAPNRAMNLALELREVIAQEKR